MLLIVGLGNPGGEYKNTRHNVGCWVADELAERVGTSFSDRKFRAHVGRGRLQGVDSLLLKPQTYMNLSGDSVGPAAGFFKIPPEDVIVVHDDLDLEVGRIKLKKGGGHGGHNGLRSLIQRLPGPEFLRVRVGIGRPPPRWDPADYVLSRFASEEREQVDQAVKDAADAVERIIRDGIQKAMSVYNRLPEKEKEKPAKKPKEARNCKLEARSECSERRRGGSGSAGPGTRRSEGSSSPQEEGNIDEGRKL